MKKKNLFLIALLCAYSTLASAYTVTDNGDGSVTIDGGQWVNTTVTDNHGDTHTEVSGAEGAGLPASFNNADKALINGATKLIFTGYINNMQAFQDLAGSMIATSVDMSEAHFQQNLNSVEEVTYDKYDPETKTTSSVTKKYMTNVMTFVHFKSTVTEVKLSKYVESICQKTFDNNSHISTFEIPSSVKYIATHGIDNTPITSLVIPANVDYIKTQSIQNGSVKVLIDVTVEGYTAAERLAFDEEITVGQTVAGQGMQYATLHFPADAVGYFTNLNHELTQEESLNYNKFHEWLTKHISVAGNGWQEFINSAPGKGEPVLNGVVLRTFSDNVPHYVPLNFRAYVVNGVTGSVETGYTMELQETFAIPANTGVILYGEVVNKSFALPILSGTQSWQITPYNRATGTISNVNLKNYLVPDVESVLLKPYDLNSNGEVTDRNFIMSKYSSTDLSKTNPIDNEYIGFFRVKAGESGTNKAYLSLPATMFTDPEGAEVKVVQPSGSTNTSFRTTEWPRDYNLYGDWGTRPTESFPVALRRNFGEPFSSAIMNVEAENEDGDIYSLLGVKVSAPQKGIYIRNGKKYLVK